MLKISKKNFLRIFLGDAHKWNQDRAIAAFNDKKSPIVIDNTALQSWEPKNYIVKGNVTLKIKTKKYKKRINENL